MRRNKVNEAVGKARKMRVELGKAVSTSTVGLLKTQELDAPCSSLCSWMSDCNGWILFLTILDLTEKQHFLGGKGKAFPVRPSSPCWF